MSVEWSMKFRKSTKHFWHSSLGLLLKHSKRSKKIHELASYSSSCISKVSGGPQDQKLIRKDINVALFLGHSHFVVAKLKALADSPFEVRVQARPRVEGVNDFFQIFVDLWGLH